MSAAENDFPLLWPPGPQQPALSGGELHIWAATLDVLPAANLVSDEERKRAARFHRGNDRVRYLAQHGLLRRLLGQYLDCDPLDISFQAGAAGKPQLNLSTAPLHFNISRSNGLGLFAFTFAGPVGVDVEVIRPIPDLDLIIQRYFNAAERSALSGRSKDQRSMAFFELWTIKEAVVKATGIGLSGLAAVEVDLDDPTRPRPRCHPQVGGSESQFSAQLTPAKNATGHVMVSGQILEMRCWRRDA